MIDVAISALASISTGALAEVLFILRRWHEARQKLRHAQESQFKVAIQSDSLLTIGRYLDDSIGQFSIDEYASKPSVRGRVDAFLDRVEEYLGPPSESGQEAQPESPKPDQPAERGPQRVVVGTQPENDDLAVVEEKLIEGVPWDALATLRRIIEMRLRAAATEHGVKVAERAGAGQLLGALQRAEVIPEGEARSLRFSINVANRAVHGYNVSSSEADEALLHARFALSRIGLIR